MTLLAYIEISVAVLITAVLVVIAGNWRKGGMRSSEGVIPSGFDAERGVNLKPGVRDASR